MEWWRAGHPPAAAAWGCICCTVPSLSSWLRVNESCDPKTSRPVAECWRIAHLAWIEIGVFGWTSWPVLAAALHLSSRRLSVGSRAGLPLRLREDFVTYGTAR